jgi:MYXO-CTERM domain-containing protein
MKNHMFSKSIALAALIVLGGAGRASAAPLIVVTPGEQNTKSGENGCGTAPCAPGGCAAVTCGGGNWHHYPEILSIMLGSGYVVNNTGDGGAILGCDAASVAIAGGNSFCKSGQYTNFTNPAPDIVIIGPFGEHDQRVLAGNAMFTTFYTEAAFEAAYDGLIKKYIALKATVKIYMMTPIDVMFNAGALPAGKNIVKDVMLAASKAAAMKNNVPIIDTYTAITMADYAVDGQVNAAAQMKMAQMILDAMKNGGGADGGAAGTGGGTDAGATGAGGTTGTAGTTGAAGAGTGTAGTTGTGTGTAGTTGSGTGTAGTTGSGTGTGGTTGTGTGTAGTTGAAGSTTGAAGSSTTGTGTGTAGSGPGPYGKGSSGGCAFASPAKGGALGVAALGMLAAVVLGRRRKRRR